MKAFFQALQFDTTSGRFLSVNGFLGTFIELFSIVVGTFKLFGNAFGVATDHLAKEASKTHAILDGQVTIFELFNQDFDVLFFFGCPLYEKNEEWDRMLVNHVVRKGNEASLFNRRRHHHCHPQAETEAKNTQEEARTVPRLSFFS